MTSMQCPCQAVHDIPPELAECVAEQGETIEVDLGYDGVYLVPRIWLLVHGFPLTGMPEVAAQYGFECLAEPRGGYA
jgi:hypothetical protein